MTHSTAPPSASRALESLLSQSNGGMQTETQAACCCGRSHCAYLAHNNAVLEGLEKDLQSAAQIGQVSAHPQTSISIRHGQQSNPVPQFCYFKVMSLTFALQALLARHEAFMADAEEERRSMGEIINRLEQDKKELEATNAKTIEENRYLLDQLEELNGNVSTSDAHITSLNATLATTRKELDKLAALADQASQLEAQLSKLENEVLVKSEESQTAVHRWKKAERTVSTLSEQVDRIEKEARDERARHAEIVTRLERRRVVERELETAAGRLKGAAAAVTVGQENGGGTVVSSFVRDILQDNANLQMGIVELREMLTGSNEEVENLREQMLLHQPMHSIEEDNDEKPSLNTELLRTPTAEMPDFHVHHHYHAAPQADAAKAKVPGIRRPKRKRFVTSPGFRTPSTGAQTPREPYSPSVRTTPASSASTILSHTSVTVPPPSQPLHAHKWSWQSTQDALSTIQSSVPSSPMSYQDQSVFDTIDDAPNSSQPTSPSSTALGSPDFPPRHSKGGSDVSIRSLSAQPVSSLSPSISGVIHGSRRLHESYDDGNVFPILDHSTIIEETEDDTSQPSTVDTDQSTPAIQDYKAFQQVRPRLQRASSAESMFSNRGVEIPIIHTKHTQLLSGPRKSLGSSTASVGPVTSSTSAVGRSFKASRHYDSSSYNRLLLNNASPTSPTSLDQFTTLRPTLGKKLGGWMTGKWGTAPTASSGDLRAKASLNAAINTKASDRVRSTSIGDNNDINRLSTHVEAVKIDSTSLEEALEGG